MDKFPVAGGACRFSQELQFVEVFHYLGFIVVLTDDTYEYSVFSIVFSHSFVKKSPSGRTGFQRFLIDLSELENHGEGIGNLYGAVALFSRGPLRRTLYYADSFFVE